MNRRHLVVAALLLSVAINLLVLGATIGRKSRMHKPSGPPPLEWTAQALPQEVRDQIRQQMRERQSDVRQLREDMRDATKAVGEAVTADTAEPTALKEALAGLRSAQSEYQAFLHNSVADVAAGLPREQRIALLRQTLARGQRANRKKSQQSPRER